MEYKGIKFDAFMFGDENITSGDKDESTIETLEGMELGWTYVCPHCIKQHKLYTESSMSEQGIEDLINDDTEDEFICCVDGCHNKNAVEISFYPDKCKLIND
jgi:hypothetical protein